MKKVVKFILPVMAVAIVGLTSCTEKECAQCLLVKVCEGDTYDDGSGAREMTQADIENLIDTGLCTEG